MSNGSNSNLSSLDKSVSGSGNSYLDHSTNNTDARDLSTHSSVDNSQHIHLNVQGGDLASLGILPKQPKEVKRMDKGNRDRLDIAIRAILHNRDNAYEDFMSKLKVMATEFPDEDDAQYYCYLLMASGSPRNYISFYENADERTYWLTFWAYSAYKRLGHSDDAELALSQLSKWKEQYTDNTLLMDAYGLVYDCMKGKGGAYKLQEAAELVSKIGRCSEYLQPLLQLTVKAISSGTLAPTGDSKEDFYLKLYDYTADRIAPRVVSAAPPQQMQQKSVATVGTSAPSYVPPTTEEPAVDFIDYIEKRKWRDEDEDKEGKFGVFKYLKWAVLVVLVVFVYKTCFSGGDDTTIQKQIETISEETPHSTEDVVTNNNEYTQSVSSQKKRSPSVTTTKSEVSSNKPVAAAETASQTSSAASAATTTSEAPSSKPMAVTETASRTSSTSSAELVEEGKRAVKSFNYRKARECFQQAANQGSSEGYFQLGMLYSNSNYDGKNTDRAISYMRQAANSGNVEAMYQVGILYTGRDNSAAKQWLQKAAANGHSKARATLERFTN